MKPASDLTGMYRSFPAYLWVEDEETRSYLEAAWNGESLIKMYVAGGHEPIRAVVKAARQDGNTHVFGLRDRDFTSSNRNQWGNASVWLFAGDTLEVENLMLDAEAIADCEVNTSKKTAAQIEARLVELAAPQVHWMACRRLISELSEAVTQDFIKHPKRDTVQTHDQAVEAITKSTWRCQVLPGLSATWGVAPAIEERLAVYEGEYGAALQKGTWRVSFSGKEILQDLRGAVWTKKQRADPEGKQAFVRAIAEAQRKLKRVPEEVIALRSAIHERIGPSS